MTENLVVALKIVKIFTYTFKSHVKAYAFVLVCELASCDDVEIIFIFNSVLWETFKPKDIRKFRVVIFL